MNTSATEDESFRSIAVLGTRKAGKTTLQRSLGTYFPKFDVNGKIIKFLVSDVQIGFNSPVPEDIGSHSEIVFVFDVTSLNSFDQTRFRVSRHARATPGALIVLVGNKIDREFERVVSKENAESFARELGIDYFETVATSQESASALFQFLAQRVLSKRMRWTTLHTAVERGRVEDLETICQHYPSLLDAETRSGLTPLHVAASHGNTDAIETLARLGCRSMSTCGFITPMHLAARGGHVEAMKMLLRFDTRMIDASYKQDPKPKKPQLAWGLRHRHARMDPPGRTPMHYAAEFGHAEAIELLVRAGSRALDTADVDGVTPFHLAAQGAAVLAIETLVRLGSKAIDTPDNDGRTPLFTAAWNGHVSAIETLVRLGSKAIDTPDNLGCTPLNVAAWKAHVSAIETLVQLGSNAIDTPNKLGLTPMHLAANLNSEEKIKALVRLGSRSIDAVSLEGKTPMHLAGIKTLVLLARLGSRAIDIPDNGGRMPCHRPESYDREAIHETCALAANPPLAEEDVLRVRCQVYFSYSLALRLLDAIVWIPVSMHRK